MAQNPLTQILNRVGRLFSLNQEPTTADYSPMTNGRQSGTAVNAVAAFEIERERDGMVKECREMYLNDPRAKQIIQTVARDAVSGGFQIEVEDEKALEEGEAMRDRLNLNGKLDDYLRLTFRDGDSFLELGVDRNLNIAKLSRKPTMLMRRASNEQDEFSDPSQAFWLANNNWTMQAPPDALWFAEWQIIHGRWDHDEGERYGRPLLSSARKAHKRLVQGELDIAVRRKTRAGLKFVHTLPNADEPDLARYKEFNKDALGNPLAAIADFFMGHDGKIDVLQGDAHLGQIDDILHHLHTFWLASPIPMSLIGYGTDIDYSVIGHQKEQYDETLREIQTWVGDQFIRPLLERQWLMKGILPEDLRYNITWSSKKELKPDDLMKVADAISKLRLLGIADEVLAVIMARFLPGIDPDLLLPPEGGGQDVDRLAAVAASLKRGLGG